MVEVMDCSDIDQPLSEPCELCCAGGGRHDMTRLCCYVRLVGSARPSKARAGAMLEVIQRTYGTPPRTQILAAIESAARQDSTER